MKNLTALGKFLTLTVLLGSLTACGTLPQQSESVQRSASVSNEGTSAIMFAFNVFEWSRYSLNEEQKRKQNTAVHAALESNYGTVYKWYEQDAKGEVKAVHGYPINSGYCRVIYTLITVRGKSRHFEETACQSSGTQNEWVWQAI